MFKLYWIAFSVNAKSICYSMNISLISVTLHFKICWHSFTQLQKSRQNHLSYVWTEPYLVWILCQCKSYAVLCSGGSRGPAPPPYFWTKLRLEGPKKNFFKTALPPLISGSGWLPRPLIWRSGSASAVCTQPYAWVNTVPINIYNS